MMCCCYLPTISKYSLSKRLERRVDFLKMPVESFDDIPGPEMLGS